jgi:hypothetical protein
MHHYHGLSVINQEALENEVFKVLDGSFRQRESHLASGARPRDYLEEKLLFGMRKDHVCKNLIVNKVSEIHCIDELFLINAGREKWGSL